MSTAERWAQIEELFHRAAECDPKQRTGLLDEACGSDLELRREVETLLNCEPGAVRGVQAAVRGELRTFGFPLSGETVSHYRILDGVGAGGMGSVYRAEDIKLGRQVALKFLSEDSLKHPDSLARFEREARSASALEHPNICPIYEFGEHAGQPFLVMQLLEGKTLRELLVSRKAKPANTTQARRPNTQLRPGLPLEKVLDLAIQIANGLGGAHSKGIIHRDIKPGNIFVTTNGQVKILDFGVAKLQHSEPADTEPQQTEEHHSDARWNPYVTLTRTGATIGTAGYMSPEQIGGEKLDARTDLFSFGLVLYEMAAGQRAFTGDTAPVLENAILHNEPTPVRDLNRAIPPKLETVINKALQKDREQRYQNVSELHADLEGVRREISPRNRFRKWMLAAGALATLLIGSSVLWFAKHAATPSKGLPDVMLQQLTDNSPENPVSGGAISPDGRYLAYTDKHGMHVKLVGSEEAESAPQPVEFTNASVVWEIASWFPDSKRFLVHSHPAPVNGDEWFSASSSTWVVSVLGGAPLKLRDNAYAWDVSPDGSTIAFGTNFGTKKRDPDDETWLMSSDGQHTRRLFPSGPVCCVHFFQDGQRVSYGYAGGIRASDLAGGPVTTLLSSSENQKIGDGILLPNGRYIYFDRCNYQDLMRADKRCNYWITQIDMQRGGMVEKPRRLTNWVGLAASNPNVTADGKRVAFLQSSSRGVGYLADLAPGGKQIIGSRRFPLEEGGEDSISSWTADSKNAIVSLMRSDRYSLRMQALNSNEQVPIMTSGASGLGIAESSVSPDGNWVVFLVQPITGYDTVNTIVQLMRVPITGGFPEPIFSTRQGTSFFCARSPSSVCAVAEESGDRKTMIVTAFDPVKGRGTELARFALDYPSDIDVVVEHMLLCDISPDGTRLALSPREEGPIEIHSLQGNNSLVIPGKTSHKLKNMKAVRWAADGKGLIVSSATNDGGGEVFHLDFQGNTNTLWKCASYCIGLPSPDGRHLAIYNQSVNANMWMMENF